MRQKDGTPVNAITFYNDSAHHTIWISSASGVYTLKNGDITPATKINHVLAGQQTNGIRRDQQGKIWIATYENGLYIFNAQQQLVKRLTQEDGFFSNSIQHLHDDPYHRLWISTPDGVGLFANTEQPDNVSVIGYAQGLTDLYIRSIKPISTQQAIICSNNNISLLDMQSDQPTARSIMPNAEAQTRHPQFSLFNFTGGILLQPDGQLMLTSQEGILALDYKRLQQPAQTIPLHIMQTLQLAKNDIKIVFGTADHAQTPHVCYQYKIEHITDDWVNIADNEITLRALPPGTHKFRLRATSSAQPWSQAVEATCTLRIPYPLWLRWYAVAAYLALFALLAWWLVRRYRRRLQLQNQLQIEQQQRQQQQRVSQERMQFFTHIAHELRTPLTLISAPLEELLQSPTLSADDRRRANLMAANAGSLHHLVDQLLDFRRAETASQPLHLVPSQLADSARAIWQTFQSNDTAHRHTWQFHADADLPNVPLDQRALATILNNLLSNAAKFTPQGGTISVSIKAASEPHRQQLIVADNGIGISPSDLPHIFEAYWQADNAHQQRGTGLGLATVKQLCLQHQIELTAQSQQGEGTQFILTFEEDNNAAENIKETKPNATTNVHEAQQSSMPNAQRSMRTILIVEDNADIRQYVATTLSETYQTLTATNGREGLQAAIEHTPDLIISDIMMPEMDGLEMAKNLKADLRTSHIPILFLTAKTTAADQLQGYQSGADDYLTKPFSIVMLKAKVKSILTTMQRLVEHTAALNSPAALTQQPAPTEPQQQLSKVDQTLLNSINDIIQSHISDPQLSVAMMADQLQLSPSTLYRKLKALTGSSPNQYIRKRRLRNSIRLMTEERRNVSQAAYESGFSDLAYFRECFKAEMGMSATEF